MTMDEVADTYYHPDGTPKRQEGQDFPLQSNNHQEVQTQLPQ